MVGLSYSSDTRGVKVCRGSIWTFTFFLFFGSKGKREGIKIDKKVLKNQIKNLNNL